MERISKRQLVLIGTCYTMDATLVSLPAQISAVAKQDAWLVWITATLPVLLSLWCLARVMARFPDQDLYTALIGRFPILGRVIASGYILFYFFIHARDLRILSDFVEITLLAQTPITVIASLVALCAIGAARGGLEMIGRMTEIFAPVLIGVVYLLPVLLLKDLAWDRVQPILEHGLSGQVKGAWYAVAYLGEIVALPLLFSNRTFTFRLGALGLAIGTGLLVTLSLLGSGVLGYPLLERSFYPSYELVRQVRVTDFLDRMDLFYVGLYFPTMLTKVGYSLYVACHGLDRVIPKLYPGLLTAPLGMLGVVCASLFFADGVQLIQLNRVWPVIALLFTLVIPLLLFAIMRPRRQGKGPNAKSADSA